ncbi:MAG: hypothetical protein ACUZ8H_01365 [Candidatus Anammoxibacter sp.]
MSNKADIEALIDANYADGLPITAALMRATLNTDSDSILNSLYGEEVTDNQAAETFLTLTTPGSATFNIRILKQGRRIRISGTVTAIGVIFSLGVLLAGDLTALIGQGFFAHGFVPSTGQAKEIKIVNSSGVTTILINPGLAIGDTINFTIFYDSDV